MFLYDNKIWQKDLSLITQSIPKSTELYNKSILVTGATGLICSALVDMLCYFNDVYDANIHIFVAGREEYKIRNRFHMERPDLHFVLYDASTFDNNLSYKYDYIIHGASNASPNQIVQAPIETMLSNFLGVKELLDYAKSHDTKRILYISSSEVYGKSQYERPRKVNDYGWIDILNPRSAYPIGKCAAETLCSLYYFEYGVNSVIIRPGHIYGPTAQKSDNRVSSAWAYAAAKGEDIVMKSNGLQLRSYCYCLDCASAILTVLLKGDAAHAYNISNPNSVITIKQMAEILKKCAKVELKEELPTEEERIGFNPMNNSALDSTELLELGWRGLFDAEIGFMHTVTILKETLDLNEKVNSSC